MKKFFNRLFLFSVLPVFLILLSDFYLVRKDPFFYKEKYENAIEQSDSIKIIALGNSHSLNSVNPKAFNLYTYNLANANQSLYFDKRQTLALINQLENLSIVLISIDFHSLYFSSQGDRDVWSYYGNGIKYKTKSYFYESISPTLFGYSPKVVLFVIKEDFLNNNNQDSRFRGHMPLKGIDSNLFKTSKYVPRAQSFNNKAKNNKKQRDKIVEDLKHFIEILKNNDITPVLFNSPTYYEFNKELDDSIYKENEEIINKIAKEYNIEYWSFMKSPLFYKSDFHNPDHLNAKGSMKFSQILNDSIEKLNKN